MTGLELSGLRVAVAGAGVLGLSIAASVARRGAQVVVFDPATLGDNASGVAAGMLSPGLEAALDGVDGARSALLRRAYAAWPDFAAAMGFRLPAFAAGAIVLGEPDRLEALAARLRAMGVDATPLSAAAARVEQPLYAGGLPGLHVREDGRLTPASALEALAKALVGAGGRRVAERLAPERVPIGFDRLVIATGDQARSWADIAPEVARLAPIKGHILSFSRGGTDGATLRGEEGYLTPQGDAVAFGATMEAGRADRDLDPVMVGKLRASALALAPGLEGAPWVARTGVRMATPDGFPLAGVSAGGAILAVGARRNGWLLAPLVAEAVVEALAGAPPRPEFDPARFDAA